MIPYRDYFIDSKPTPRDGGGWSASVAIWDTAGVEVQAVWPAEFIARTYATDEEARQAGIAAGKHWIEGMPDLIR